MVLVLFQKGCHLCKTSACSLAIRYNLGSIAIANTELYMITLDCILIINFWTLAGLAISLSVVGHLDMQSLVESISNFLNKLLLISLDFAEKSKRI